MAVQTKKGCSLVAEEFHWGPANPHPLSKMRTELVWDGKYDEYGRRREVDVAACSMPLQRIETVDEPRQRAEAAGQLSLFEEEVAGRQRDDFRNRLIWGDNKLVMASLLREFKGKVDLIYIDPPFDVGADFTMDVPLGDGKETVGKDQSTLEMVAYRDMWGKGTDSYLHMMFERLVLMRELLKEEGGGNLGTQRLAHDSFPPHGPHRCFWSRPIPQRDRLALHQQAGNWWQHIRQPPRFTPRLHSRRTMDSQSHHEAGEGPEASTRDAKN